jgi:hypothetical protein
MASTAADVLNASAKRRVDPIEGLEEWGLTLYMVSLTEREKSEYEYGLINPETGEIIPGKVKQARASLITRVVCDEDGKPIFTESQVKALMGRDSKLIGLLDKACRAHVGISKAEKKTDSDSESDDDSPSDSASPSDDSTSTKS